MTQLRMLSLCSGIGGLDIAAEMTGAIKVVGQVEDIFHVRGDEFGPVDIVAAGFPCFVAGTLVETDNGPKPIEHIEIGDQVLTHACRYRPVNAVMKRQALTTAKVRVMGVARRARRFRRNRHIRGGPL